MIQTHLSQDATEAYVNGKVTSLQSAIDGKADMDDIPSLAGYATEAYVNGNITSLQSAINEKADASDIPSLAGYATEEYVNGHHDSTKQDTLTPPAITSPLRTALSLPRAAALRSSSRLQAYGA